MSDRLTALSRLTPRARLHVRRSTRPVRQALRPHGAAASREEVMPHSEQGHQPPDRGQRSRGAAPPTERSHAASSPTFLSRFEREVDPNGELPPDERHAAPNTRSAPTCSVSPRGPQQLAGLAERKLCGNGSERSEPLPQRTVTIAQSQELFAYSRRPSGF